MVNSEVISSVCEEINMNFEKGLDTHLLRSKSDDRVDRSELVRDLQTFIDPSPVWDNKILLVLVPDCAFKNFISTKDDESWKWTPERELNSFEIQELGFNCERARMLLEETVNEEYCTYITSKYQNFEAILQNMADQFNHIDCGDSILMRCNGEFLEVTWLQGCIIHAR